MVKVPIKFGDPFFIFKQMQHIYRTPPNAFKEYPSNSFDLENRINGRPVEVAIIVNKSNGVIIVRDDGAGMTYEKLKSLPESVGLSSKRGMPSSIGEKGIGIFAYAMFADRCNIYSRSMYDKDDLFNYLTLEKDSRLTDVERVHINELPFRAFEHGTYVYLSGISEDKIAKYFTPAKISDLIADMYAPLLRNGIIKAKVGYISGRGENLTEIEPVKYDTRPILDEIIEIPFKKENGDMQTGHVELLLFVDPAGKNEKVKYYNHGVKVLDSISFLDELSEFPWKSGKLYGEVNEDFLTLNAQRDAPIKEGNRYKIFIDTLLNNEAYLNKRIKELKGGRDKSKLEEIASVILRNFDYIFQDLKRNYPDFFDLWIKGKPGDEIKKVVETGGSAVPGSSGRKKIIGINEDGDIGGEEGNIEDIVVEDEEGEHRPVKPRPRKIFSSSYRVDFSNFDIEKQSLRSEYDETYGLIAINTDHPDYRRIHDIGDQKKLTRYVTYLVSKDIALGEFKKLCKRNGFDPVENAHVLTFLATELYLREIQLSGVE